MVFDCCQGPAGPDVLAENMRRLLVLVFDYVNTLKPIADMEPEIKVDQAPRPKHSSIIVGFHSEELCCYFFPAHRRISFLQT